MALSSVTLIQLRSDLRLRLNEISEGKFVDEELDRWLNLAQYETAIKLNGISDVWYGSRNQYVLLADFTTEGNFFYIDVSALNIFKLIQTLYYTGSTTDTWEDIPLKNFRDLKGYQDNSFYSATRMSALWGTRLYLTVDPDLGTDSKAVAVFYYRKPVEMTSSLTLDIPTEFQELVVLGALKTALGKLGLAQDSALVEADLAKTYNDIKQSFIQGDSEQIAPVRKTK